MILNNIKEFIIKFKDLKKLNDATYKFEDLIEFLKNSLSNEVPLIAYGESFYIHSLIVPKENLTTDSTKELLNWSFYRSGYGYAHNNGEYRLTEPCESYKPNNLLKNATPPFIERNIFEGTATEIDINQKISNRLDIARIDTESNFYKLNKNYEHEEVAKIIRDDKITLCTLNREEIDKYLTISNSILIRFFDALIYEHIEFCKELEEIIELPESNIYFNYITNEKSSKKWIRGFQLIDYENRYDEHETEKINYQTFIIQDYDTKEIIEHTCNPNKLSNRFNNSDEPFELSNVFFKPEVLRDYKGDSEKFQISDRRISKGNYWDLNYSMSDDESQIIVYLIDLGHLPESEQMHWKIFNEKPHSKLSEQVYKQDFLAEWIENENTLEKLKRLLKEFPECEIDGNKLQIWKERNQTNIRNINNLQYVRYGSKEEWENEIEKLCQIVVEGLRFKSIKKISEKLGCYDESLKSIKLLKKCLESKGYENEKIEKIIEPLETLNRKRINIDHPKTENIYPENLIEDYANVLNNIYASLKSLKEIIDSGEFNFNN